MEEKLERLENRHWLFYQPEQKFLEDDHLPALM